MAHNFGIALNLNQNELQNAVIQTLATAPATPIAGQIYYDSALTQFGYYNGSTWIYVTAAGMTDLALGTIDGTTVVITSSTGNDVTLLSANATDAGLMPAADKVKSDFITVTQAVDLDAMETDISEHQTLFGVADGSTSLGTFTGSTITDTTVKGALQELETALETAIDISVATPEAYDPSGTSAFPVTYSGGAIRAGHSFRISAAGTMASGAVTVNPEDLVIALVDTPTDASADWQVIESNRDQATETVLGVARIATSAETTAGTNDVAYLTPLKGQDLLNSRTYEQTGVALGTGTAVNVVHNLNTSSPHVTTINETDNEIWTLDVSIVDANTLAITKNGTSENFTVRVSY